MKKLFLLLLLAGLLTACTAQEAPTFAIVTLGADSVYVGNHGVMVPDNIDAELIADINIVYMGTLYDVLSLGFWNCKTEIENLMGLWFPWTDDICTFLVFEFVSRANEHLGHSITHSPIWNAHTHECYEIDFIETKTLHFPHN